MWEGTESISLLAQLYLPLSKFLLCITSVMSRTLFPFLSENTPRSLAQKSFSNLTLKNHFSSHIQCSVNASAKIQMQKQQTSATYIIQGTYMLKMVYTTSCLVFTVEGRRSRSPKF